jgi:hypothetical protein
VFHGSVSGTGNDHNPVEQPDSWNGQSKQL